MRVHTVLLGWLLVACASSASSRVPPGNDRDLLMASEIEYSNAGTLHEAIQRLRPHFFFSRGRTSIRAPNNLQPVVIVNGVPQANIGALRTISAQTVQLVRLLSGAEATTRFGTGYMAGVIEVVLK